MVMTDLSSRLTPKRKLRRNSSPCWKSEFTKGKFVRQPKTKARNLKRRKAKLVVSPNSLMNWLKNSKRIAKESQMGKQRKRPSKADIREAKVIALADLMRLQDQAGTMEISRDYFRANSTIGDGWNRYWCSFKAFLA